MCMLFAQQMQARLKELHDMNQFEGAISLAIFKDIFLRFVELQREHD